MKLLGGGVEAHPPSLKFSKTKSFPLKRTLKQNKSHHFGL